MFIQVIVKKYNIQVNSIDWPQIGMVMYGIKHSHFFGSGSKPVSHCYHAYTVRYTCKGTLQQQKIKLLSLHDTWSHNCSISLNSATRNWYLILKTWKINKPSIYWLYLNGSTWREFKKTTTIFFTSYNYHFDLHILHREMHNFRTVLGVFKPENVLSSILTSHGKPSRYRSASHGFLMSFTKIHHERFWVFYYWQ